MNTALLPVQLQDTWILLDAPIVREVLGRQPWLRVPQATSAVPGVCVWRGRAIPVVDLAYIVGLGSTDPETYTRTLIVEQQLGLAALPVHAVQVVRFSLQGKDVTSQGLPFTTGGFDLDGLLVARVDLSAALGTLGARADDDPRDVWTEGQ